MGVYVIRGKSGMRFESCGFGRQGKEGTYNSLPEAQLALKQIQESLPFEEFEIIEI